MKAKLNKGTEIFKFFGEFYNFLSDHYVPENTDEYWESTRVKSEEILKKYEKCDFQPLAKGLLLVVIVWLSDVKLKGITHDKGGHWQISYKR